MFDRILEVGPLNCIYFAMVMSGLIYAVGMFLLGDIGGDGDVGDVGDVGGDVDADIGGDLAILSPITIVSFITAFGATGLICTVGLGMDSLPSLVVSFLLATVVGLIVAVLYGRLLVAMHGTTEIRQADMVGILGQVTTPIPANGMGEVLYEIQGERGNKAARSSDQTAIPRGTTVVVEEIVGGVLIVRPRQPAHRAPEAPQKGQEGSDV